MSITRRRPRPAKQDWEAHGEIRLFYVSLYANDPDFQRSLLDLYDTHCAAQAQFLAHTRSTWDVYEATWRDWPSPLPGKGWTEAYLSAVSTLADHVGLQRLARRKRGSSQDFNPSAGEELIHAWCSARASALQGGHDWSPELLIAGAHFGGGRPEIGEVVRSEKVRVSHPCGEGLTIVDERRKPLVHIRIEDAWDPRDEPRTKARERLIAEAKRQIDAELARIVADAEARGYVFPDHEETERDLTWLFWKARHRLSYGEIVQRTLLERSDWLRKTRSAPDTRRDPALDTDRVKRAVIRMADRVGVDRAGWEKRLRGDM